MGGSVADWPQLYTSIFENLKPGGWVEMQEYEAWISSDDDPELTKAPNTKLWQELVDEASTKFGKRMNVAREQKRWIEEAGFVDVREDVVKASLLSFHPLLCLHDCVRFLKVSLTYDLLHRFLLDIGPRIPNSRKSDDINENI